MLGLAPSPDGRPVLIRLDARARGPTIGAEVSPAFPVI